MPHEEFGPVAGISCQGDAETGDIVLFYLDAKGNSIGIRLTPGWGIAQPDINAAVRRWFSANLCIN